MDFYRRMEMVCREIPYGKAVSYGQIALLCGKPRNARQVGFALSHRLVGDHIPAHRIVNSAGKLSGARSFETPDRQRELLEAEGVEVDEESRVDLRLFGWYHTLELAEELRRRFEEEGI